MNQDSNQTLIIEVVPLGRVPEVDCEIAAANLQALLEIPTLVTPPWPEPDYAFLPTRRQFDASRILKFLSESLPPTSIRLGITTLDLCLPILTHVYGEAWVGGRLAVLSLFRLSHQPGRARVAQGLLYERLAKVALHEVTHALGVEHCRVPGCLMQFSGILEQLDVLTLSFCPACQQDLIRHRENVCTL